jgi:hypothetical protein
VEVVSRFLVAPQEPHFDAAILIFYYLKGTLDLAICYRKEEEVYHHDFLIAITLEILMIENQRPVIYLALDLVPRHVRV